MNVIHELIVDAYGCRGDLHHLESLERAARDAVEAVGATVASSSHFRFQPHGLTLCLILKESHLIVSTWPEHKLVIVNVFLCNPKMDANQVWKALETYLQPKSSILHNVSHQISESTPKKKAA